MLQPERIYIADSVGRVLAENVISKIPMPPFHKSAVDGYALKAAQAESAGILLTCTGLIQAGETFGKEIKPGECIKIMTGAAVPESTDAVIMVEDTRPLEDGTVEILKSVKKGQNICVKGEDIAFGQKVIEKGTLISSSHVAVMASSGRKTIKVYGRPEVAILNTGGEIVPVGRKITGNRIYNSNGPMLEALLKEDGIQANSLGIAKDTEHDLQRALEKGLTADVLLVSGGVSMGDYDLVPAILKEMGVKELFHTVRIKPGKPLFFGVKRKKIIFGIPGNPVSNFLTYLLFIRPALHAMMGYTVKEPVVFEGLTSALLHSDTNRKHFIPARICKKGGDFLLTPVSSHGSADILALSNADAFLMLEEGSDIKQGAKVKFVTWKRI